MPIQEQALRDLHQKWDADAKAGLVGLVPDKEKKSKRRIRGKIINDWKENQSFSFGGYFDITKDECYKHRWEISVSIMFAWWHGWLTLTIGKNWKC